MTGFKLKQTEHIHGRRNVYRNVEELKDTNRLVRINSQYQWEYRLSVGTMRSSIRRNVFTEKNSIILVISLSYQYILFSFILWVYA